MYICMYIHSIHTYACMDLIPYPLIPKGEYAGDTQGSVRGVMSAHISHCFDVLRTLAKYVDTAVRFALVVMEVVAAR